MPDDLEESAPLLISDDEERLENHQTAEDGTFLSLILQEKPTALSKVLVVLCLFLLLLSSVFIGMYAGTKQRLSEEEKAPITTTLLATTTRLETTTRTLTTTSEVAPTPDPVPTPTVCVSPECVVLAASIINSMNMSVDPCDNLYEYANGGWIQQNPLPSGKSQFSVFDQVSQSNTQVIKRILERRIGNADVSKPAPALAKLQDFFESCTEEEILDSEGEEPLRKVVRRINLLLPIDKKSTEADVAPQTVLSGMQYEHDLTDILAYLHSLDINAIFDVDIDGDVGVDPDFMTLWFSQNELGLPSKEYFDDEDTIFEYQKVIQTLLHHFDEETPETSSWPPWWPWPEDPPPENRSTKAERLSNEAVSFEKALAKIGADIEVLLVDPLATYNPQPLSNLTERTPYIDFPRYVSAFAPRNFPERVIVTHPPYPRKLARLIQATPRETLRAYFISQTILQLSPFLGPSTLPWKVVKEFEQGLNGIKKGVPEDREKWCLSQVEGALGFLSGHFFVEEVFSNSAQIKATNVIEDIIAAFNRALPDLTWMDKKSSISAAEKAKALRIKVGYPLASPITPDVSSVLRYYAAVKVAPDKFFSNVLSARVSTQIKKWAKLGKKRDKEEWEMVPAEVNAYYNPPANEIVFPAGILQPPFFGETWPAYLTYGAIGSVAAHELTHAFDSAGRLYNQRGKLEPWWSNATSEHFETRKVCLANQYSTYTVDDGKGRREHVNGNLTSGENIGDSGLIHSWRAWKAQNNATADYLLPGLSELSQEQLFFVAFARVWASRTLPSAAVRNVRTNPHSPAIYRVHGTLSNIPEFARTFNCSVKAKLNPQKRCMFW